MTLQYCAGNHDDSVIINATPELGPFCCETCRDAPHSLEACGCEDVSAPHAGNAPAYAKASGGGKK